MTMYQRSIPLTPTNNRLDFLKQTHHSMPKKYHTSQPRNDRLDFLRTPPAPKNNSPVANPPNRNYARRNLKPVVLNDRFQKLKPTPIKEPKKKTFVAFPSRNQWDQGFRPAWILRSNKDPPGNYDEAYKIYKHYLMEDEIVIPDRKYVGDKAKQISTTFMNKINKKK